MRQRLEFHGLVESWGDTPVCTREPTTIRTPVDRHHAPESDGRGVEWLTGAAHRRVDPRRGGHYSYNLDKGYATNLPVSGVPVERLQ